MPTHQQATKRPEKKSLGTEEESSHQAGSDPIILGMKRRGTPVTLGNWLALARMPSGTDYEKLTAEEQAEVPLELRPPD